MTSTRKVSIRSMKSAFSKGWLVAVGAYFALALGTVSQIHAQSVAGITGVAGFETGLQVIASVRLAHVSKLGDLNPPGAIIRWGDNSNDNQGLLVCSGGEDDPCTVYGSHWYTFPGIYTISIIYSDPAPFLSGPGAQHTLTTTATITAPWNDPAAYVIVSIGDSVASGEGNPSVPNSNENYPGWGFWDDPNSDYVRVFYPADEQQAWPSQSFPCHRSSWAGPAQAAAQLQATNPGVTFIHYACSGAKVSPGDTDNDEVQDTVNQLRIVRQRVPRIDVLLISAGSNNLHGAFGSGFGQLVKRCLLDRLPPCSSDSQLSQDITNSLAQLGGSYARLAAVINCTNPDTGAQEQSCNHPQDQIPKMVLITEYMDPTHDRYGNYPVALEDQCVGLFATISNADWIFFHNSIVHPLNQAVDSFPGIAQRVGFSGPVLAIEGIENDFLMHGVCAGNERWVFDIADSKNLLGSDPHKDSYKTNGTGHPIALRYQPDLGLLFSPPYIPCCGQEDYRDRIYASIVHRNPPVTTASATAGGAAYTFGTWALQDVVVTLSATNPIKEAGVEQTVYAVDDPNCNPVTLPACSTYAGPFTISKPGKHTVTFGSLNASGWPATFQTVQVWVDLPPVMTCSATPSVLWPPNNKMVPVSLNVTAVSAAFGPTPFSLKSVMTSEGNAATDIHGFVIGQPSTEGSLLASRLGYVMAGRVYTFVYQSTDELGLTGTCTAKVQVPHDQRRSSR